MSKTIAVTGGAGFLGSHVADALTAQGNTVKILDRSPSPYLKDGQTMEILDILDSDAVMKAVEGCSVVVHMAAVADIGEALGDPRHTIEVNVMGTVNLLEAAVAQKVDRFLLASSIYVYSEQGGFYRTSKQAAERLVQDYWDKYSLPYNILRFGSLYGPRAGETNAVTNLLRQALNERKLDYWGTGEEIREYIHVADAAAMTVEVLEEEYQNQIVHLTGRERMKTRELLEMINEIMGGDVAISILKGENTAHYYQTPYNYLPRIGRKMTMNTYIDLGLGLLDCLQMLDAREPSE